MTQKSGTHVFKTLNTSKTICGENCESALIQVSLYMKKYKCIWLVWIITACHHISPEVTAKGFKKCWYPMQWMSLMVVGCGMTLKRLGMLGEWEKWRCIGCEDKRHWPL